MPRVKGAAAAKKKFSLQYKVLYSAKSAASVQAQRHRASNSVWFHNPYGGQIITKNQSGRRFFPLCGSRFVAVCPLSASQKASDSGFPRKFAGMKEDKEWTA